MNRRTIEVLIVIVVAIVAITTMWYRTQLIERAVKENLLQAELKSLRVSLQMYLVVNKGYPQDLQTLSTNKYDLGDTTDAYLKGVELDSEKYPIDPFGKRFHYSPQNGWVNSAVPRYSSW